MWLANLRENYSIISILTLIRLATIQYFPTSFLNMYNFQDVFLPQDKLYISEPQTKSLLARESLNYFYYHHQHH